MPTPLEYYQSLLSTGEINTDDAQANGIDLLQALFDDIVLPVKKRGFFSWFYPAINARPRLRGYYFWGGVGRGKTFLMDVFFESLPIKEKRRMHFHRFMRHIHQQLKIRQGESNPLEAIAIEFASQVRVLCFDEFFVSDITDAMLLAGLLEVMFNHGVILIATSNLVPDRLYENGLQRSRFLPAIELIKTHTHVVNLDGGIDYRLRVLEAAEIYHYPLDENAELGLQNSFRALSPDHQGADDVDLEIEHRIIHAKRCGDGVAWFEFSALCEGPRSQNDYIELATIFQTVLISNVPRFDATKEAAARRFISLVDELYDHRVKLILSAAAAIDVIYQGNLLHFEFERTKSRLVEMQSHAYLAQEHKP